jgi:hypothetical protein
MPTLPFVRIEAVPCSLHRGSELSDKQLDSQHCRMSQPHLDT